MALATVADVEAVTGATVAAGDIARVQRLLDMAADIVRAYTGQTLDAVASDVVIVRIIDGELLLPQRPVTAVTSIVSDGATTSSTGYRWSSSGRVWRTPSGYFEVDRVWSGREVTVTYSHGYTTGPAWLASIIARMVAVGLAVGGVGAVQSETVGSYSVTYRDSSDAAAMGLSAWARTLLARKLGRGRVGTITLQPTPISVYAP